MTNIIEVEGRRALPRAQARCTDQGVRHNNLIDGLHLIDFRSAGQIEDRSRLTRTPSSRDKSASAVEKMRYGRGCCAQVTQTELEAGMDPQPIQWDICDSRLRRPFGRSSPVWRQSSFWVAVERHRTVVFALNRHPPSALRPPLSFRLCLRPRPPASLS
jgi:hypothetical protein